MLPLSDLIGGLSIAELGETLLRALDQADDAADEDWGTVAATGDVPLSYGQRALWLLHQLAPENGAYHIVSALRLRGPLDVPALQRSFQRAVDRHPALRTRFPSVDGQPLQRVLPHAGISFLVDEIGAADAASLGQFLLANAYRPFDLEHGPLLRVQIIITAPDEYVLLLVAHHLTADFWSLALLAREVGQVYAAEIGGPQPALPDLPIDYRAYVDWQTRRLAGPAGTRLWDYWRRRLAGPLPALNLPTDRPRPAVQRSHGASLAQALDADLSGELRALARARGATLYTVLLAAFAVLLQRYSDQDDLLIGTVTTGRDRAILAGVVGYFVNSLVLRIQPEARMAFAALLGQVRNTVLEAFEHQDYPFPLLVERLQPARDPGRSPLFQVMFQLQQPPHAAPAGLGALALGAPGVRLDLGGLQLESLGLPQPTAQFDLALLAAEHEGRLLLAWNYNTDLFDAATIRRMGAHFQVLLAGIVARPDASLAALPLLPEPELRYLRDELNNTGAPIPTDLCLHHLIAAQAARTPDAIALRFANQQISYRTLERRANQLAQHLRDLGVGPETRVGLLAERSPELVIGLLGILKAGGAYVPLDPDFPRERLALMLEDAQVSVLLTAQEQRTKDQEQRDSQEPRTKNQEPTGQEPPSVDSASRFSVLGSGAVVVDLHADWEQIARQPAADPDSGAVPDNLAYVIYTSGSTGRPKGVQISHRAVVNFLLAMARRPGIAAADVLLLVTTISFDIAALEIFLPLVAGACLQIVPRATLLDGAGLAEELRRTGVTLMQATPATWRLLLAAGWAGAPHLRLLCGGEAFPRDLAEALSPRGAALWNMYGPTETTIWSAAGPVSPGAGPVTIGPPIANTQLYVLDHHMHLAPIGVPGELYIGGDGLARGYLGRPDLTAERFVPCPWSVVSGQLQRTTDPSTSLRASNGQLTTDNRLYRTGDLVRRLADGTLEFLGRLDHQVKLRGFRIELGEIETALLQHPQVRQAVVLAREDRPGEKRLVAYVVSSQLSVVSSNGQLTTDNGQRTTDNGQLTNELRAFLKQRLPDYMIPTVLLLAQMPLTPNGKVNRQALPAPHDEGAAPHTDSPPRTELERMIARVWQGVLDVDRVGVHDNFFDLGGHSLLLARVHQRLRELLPGDLPIVDLFRYPTVSALAQHLSGGAPAPATSVRRALGAGQDRAVAIVGMAGRFPGAGDIGQFWANLRDGVESITIFGEQELRDAGIDPAMLGRPNYVRARATLADADRFDAGFFGFTPREAEILDPQHRLFLEASWEALEHAGYDSERYPGRIGVFAGVGINSYLLEADPARIAAAGRYQAFISNDKDFVPTRVSYKLNLRGPSVTVQTACSSSLVAVHLACQSLLNGECDMVLAGGVAISVPQQAGYLYEDGGIASPDGHCRAFDAAARGTVFGSGVGVVLLKPLADALNDGDTIYAVVKGSAINNDGAAKVGYTAPSAAGQAQVIGDALAAGGVPAETIGYVEAHGTGTALGDPVEVAALTEAYRAQTDRRQFCALGSLKTNIGHLDTAAGIAGLIKTALALQHKQLPPSLHFHTPNPNIDFGAGPFFVNAALRDWPADGVARRAGVSSFGIGGTNAHLVLEEAPLIMPTPAMRPWHLLLLSAKTASALDQASARLAAHLRANPQLNLADVAYTLQVGRRAFDHRRIVISRDAADAAEALESRGPARVWSATRPPEQPAIVFMFPGQGTQYVDMGRELYDHEPVFRAEIDRCAELLRPHLGLDIRQLIYPKEQRSDQPDPVRRPLRGRPTDERRPLRGRPTDERRPLRGRPTDDLRRRGEWAISNLQSPISRAERAISNLQSPISNQPDAVHATGPLRGRVRAGEALDELGRTAAGHDRPQPGRVCGGHARRRVRS